MASIESVTAKTLEEVDMSTTTMTELVARVTEEMGHELSSSELERVRVVVDNTVFNALLKSELGMEGATAEDLCASVRATEAETMQTVRSAKAVLDDLNADEDTLNDVLTTLARQHITFNILKKTAIGLSVNALRKRSTGDLKVKAKALLVALKAVSKSQ